MKKSKVYKRVETSWKTDPSEKDCLKQGGHKLWKFVHHDDFQYQSTMLEGREFEGKWLKIDNDGTITVKGSQDQKRGYAWDGCTPKFNFLQITWGNFDGNMHKHFILSTGQHSYKPKTYYASMVHDVLYQYKRCVPVTRKEADRIFLYQLREAKWMWAGLYWVGVRLFGWVFRGWAHR